MLTEEYIEENFITATPAHTYLTKEYDSGIFAATNGYMFDTKNASPRDSFIQMGANGRDGHIRVRRHAEGKLSAYGQKTNEFVAAFPCWVLGMLNFREASNQSTLDQLPDVLRQYDFPAFDAEQVRSNVGLPSSIKDLKEFIVRTTLQGNFYGVNGFLDMYLHDADSPNALQGYRGTLNGGNGTHTKAYNINTWFKYPEQENIPGAIGGGWSGAVKIADKRINDTNVIVALKIERVGDNEFAYICLMLEDGTEIDWNVMGVMEWVLSDLWHTLQSSNVAMKMLGTMAEIPPIPHDGLKVCGPHLGCEVWWSDPNLDFNEIIFKNLEFRVNGVSRFLDGVSKDPSPSVKEPIEEGDTKEHVPPPIQEENQDNQVDCDKSSTNKERETEDLVFRNIGDVKPLPGSEKGGRITSMGNDNNLVKITGDHGPITLEAMRYGKTMISWVSEHGDRATKVIVKK